MSKMTPKPLTPTMEDYLEAIFDLSEENKVVRVRDIARRLSVKTPTVTSMLKNLNDRGLVNHEKYEYVELTSEGDIVGREMRRRHGVLLEFLHDVLKIDHETADGEACKMEHTLSSNTLDSLVDFMEFIRSCPRTGEGWLDNFEEFRRHGSTPPDCAVKKENFTREFERKFEALKKD